MMKAGMSTGHAGFHTHGKTYSLGGVAALWVLPHRLLPPARILVRW